MKTLKYIIIFTIWICSFSSCSLFQDSPIDKITQETIWNTPSLMDAYMLPIYRNMHNGNKTSMSTSSFLKNNSINNPVWFTDQVSVGYKKAYSSSSYGNLLKGHLSTLKIYANKLSSVCYDYIRSVNLLIENSNKIISSKERVLGEAHFFRGWYYFRMFREFGGVMLIDKVENPLIEVNQYPRASFDEMVNFIITNADEAARMLSATYTSEHSGRIRKGAAIMLKAKTYYWASSKRFQNADKSYLGFTSDRSEEMLKKSAKAYEELFLLPDHELIEIIANKDDKYGIIDEYRKIFLVKHSKESIFEFNHNNQGEGDGNIAFSNIDKSSATPVDNNSQCAWNPTQNHVNEYRMSNGMRISDISSGYNAQNPYIDRDVRFYSNILYDGSRFRNRKMDIRSKWASVSNKFVPGKDMTPSLGTNGASNTGYYMAKLLDEKFAFTSKYSTQNCIIWRLAEAYLDYAHIQFNLGKTSIAAEYVNRVRSRVKEIALTSITLEDIMNERKVELAFEESIYWDMMMSDNPKVLRCGSTNPIYGVAIEEKEGSLTYIYNIVNGDNDETRFFDKRQLFSPLHWDDIRYHGVEQNPGWIE